MSYLGSCGLHQDHPPHVVTAAPEGGVGGHYCDGYGVPYTDQERALLDAFGKRITGPLLWEGDDS